MKAATNVNIDRTDGDTGPMLVRLQWQTCDGDVDVASAAAVTMRVENDPVILIDGQPSDGGLGVFGFPPDLLPAGKSTLDFSIIVDEGEGPNTHSRGRIFTKAKI